MCVLYTVCTQHFLCVYTACLLPFLYIRSFALSLFLLLCRKPEDPFGRLWLFSAFSSNTTEYNIAKNRFYLIVDCGLCAVYIRDGVWTTLDRVCLIAILSIDEAAESDPAVTAYRSHDNYLRFQSLHPKEHSTHIYKWLYAASIFILMFGCCHRICIMFINDGQNRKYIKKSRKRATTSAIRRTI